jgi:hypothetical protein
VCGGWDIIATKLDAIGSRMLPLLLLRLESPADLAGGWGGTVQTVVRQRRGVLRSTNGSAGGGGGERRLSRFMTGDGNRFGALSGVRVMRLSQTGVV